MAETMIERAARALAKRHGAMLYQNGASNYSADQHADRNWRDYVEVARAVLNTMREPTEVVTRAGVLAPNYLEDQSSARGFRNMWNAGINAALTEEG